MSEILTPERILEAAEEVFRRFGPQKTTVVDVARALGVSHGSVYRHFDSKIALRDAVVERWLKRTSDPLKQLTKTSAPAPQRLRNWFDALLAAKRSKVSADPELFAVSRGLFAEARDVVAAHVAGLVGQIEIIVADGVQSGEFVSANPTASARAIFDATARFHDPAHMAEWADPEIDAAFEGVFALILTALLPPKAPIATSPEAVDSASRG
ncbi:MAG TPA: TetR family transcriptional regulator [Arsenicitalea sp.]|jgi:AcrR family transcriptional regulator|nr:TetR family transcriptional regulator [Arsenicitalea sp.]